MDLSFMSSIACRTFGPRLLQFGAEKEGREAPVRSRLSLLTVCLELGRRGGRGQYSSYQGGGGREEGGALWIFRTTWICCILVSSSSDMELRSSQIEPLL